MSTTNQPYYYVGDLKAPLGLQSFPSSELSLGATIYDQSLKKEPVFWPVNTFAFLFAQTVDYYQHRVDTIRQLEEKLSSLGGQVGSRILDSFMSNHQKTKREQRVLSVLLLVKVSLWKHLFGKEADQLEQSNDADGTYYIIEKDAVTNRFISVPKDKSSLNCGAFLAGLIQGFLTDSGFACQVNAHAHKGTTLVIEFDKAVILRDKNYDSNK